MELGSRLGQLRERSGWTQEDMAEKLGITRAALSHYEKSRRKPDFDTLIQAADLFGVSVDYLIGRLHHGDIRPNSESAEAAPRIELADLATLSRLRLEVDGEALTYEEARRFVAFVRAERMMR
ncbi:helix-turn-helix domain-containing protein [Paenibacillus thiaminolyticus]|uniref:Helix-turn-helix domain-containing protein n=1 Tax=Paenibacillus thiaminolyticus TaxID=49283 RepID=A0AAP9J175_PANTH|nr:helix-turn-helix transcriptional regulator [Paenibacillus thiaminolyticus]MCY9533773.1 helix-turn-helix domain-containing protein [Paenibacillus thiaminolyticus]MCY9600265.1 helix-turn-helix domain-containing protein [Paenibacillus thiaminolyticus]MCY9607824.1 helix-turn-helix domain-containing protein [Paenibacillus thiaminolyticus]MCY9611923.1 helix-turn-helix domain-containing protein [Paenibacillus thiaminolyticus]MCY9617857.1 helix-turn-helix domain-containing protein [Paenibacillus th